MLVVSRFVLEDTDGDAAGGLLEEATAALAALSQRPGFVRGRFGRATDDPGAWVLVTEWDGVGSYRRSLSAFDVRVHAAPLLARAEPEAGAYEVLLTADGSGPVAGSPSRRAADADRVRVGEAAGADVPTTGTPPDDGSGPTGPGRQRRP